MSKQERRQAKRGMDSAAGDVKRELEELEKLQKAGKDSVDGIMTITVGCTTLFSIACC